MGAAFNVKFTDTDFGEDFEWLEGVLLCYEPPPREYEIHKKSLHIFEPKVGDMILFRGEYGACVDRVNGYKIPNQNIKGCDYVFTDMLNMKLINKEIIRRDGKSFIMPQREKK